MLKRKYRIMIRLILAGVVFCLLEVGIVMLFGEQECSSTADILKFLGTKVIGFLLCCEALNLEIFRKKISTKK